MDEIGGESIDLVDGERSLCNRRSAECRGETK